MIETLQLPNGRLALRVAIGLLALICIAVLIQGPLSASAQADGPQAVPDVPDKPAATAIYEGMVDLEWDEAPGAESYDVQALYSDWFDLPGNGISIAFYGPGAIIEGLTPESRYYFRVRATNSLGSSQWSEHSSMVRPTGAEFHNWNDVPEPTNSRATGAPTISGTVRVGDALTADESGIEDENGLDRVKFHYQWVSSDGTDEEDIEEDIEGGTDASYVLVAADEGRFIKVRVSFTDRGGYAESVPSAATTEVKPPPDPPGPPFNLQVPTDENEELSFSWDAPASDGGSAVTGYKVRWKSGSEEYHSSREASVSGLSHTVRNLDNGVEYTVQVVAVNRVGEGEAAEITATPGDTTPPELLTARVNGPTIALTYDDALDANSTPAISAFSVLVGGAAREVSKVSVSGSSVSLTLAPAVMYGDTVALSYSAPQDTGEQRVQDTTGNHAPSYSDEPVTNDTPKPNVRPTGLPTISGTAQVGRTLTADPSPIADEDGLTNVSYAYQWVRSDGTTDTEIPDATESSYTPVADDEGRTIKVKVSFTDDRNTEETVTSEDTAVVTPAPVRPAEPLDLRVSRANSQELDCSWQAPASDGRSAITGYTVQWKEAAGSWDTPADVSEETVTGKAHTITGLTDGVEYTVRALATNGIGDGPWSAVATGTPWAGPGAPSIASVTPGDETLTIVWTAPSEEAAVTGYDLRYIHSDAADKSDANWTVQAGVWNSGELRYDLGGLANGVKYEVEIRPVESTGPGPWSGTRAGTPMTRPGAPAIDSLTRDTRPPEEIGPPSHALLKVAWSPPADNGGSAITSYDLRLFQHDYYNMPWSRYQIDREWFVLEDIWDSGDLNVTLQGMVKGVNYEIHIRAVNAAGEGPWSAGARKRFASAPSRAKMIPFSEDGEMWISVNPPPHHGGSPITSYDVRYIPANAPDKSDANWTLLEDLEPWGVGVFWGMFSYDVTGLTNGTWYLWQARAVNDVGHGQWSESFRQRPGGKPSPPILDKVIAGDETLTLGWHRPTDDGGVSIHDYTWCVIPSDKSKKYGLNWTCGPYYGYGPIEDIPYLKSKIRGLTNGVEYDARVFAHGEVDWSEDSNMLSGIPREPFDGPTITGTARVGGTLETDTSGITDADGLTNPEFSYQWIRSDDADIAGATSSSYTLVSEDEGKTIKVAVSFTDDAGNQETLTSEATATVRPDPYSEATGAPAIIGTVRVGETLEADTSGIVDADGLDKATFTYQWSADNADIQDATNSTYTLTDADEGKTIKVRVSFTDDVGNQETLTSEATAAVAAEANTQATGAPTIGGTAQVGQTLTVNVTGIADEDGLTNPGFAYQWIGNDGTADTDIAGATGDTYALMADDVGKTIKVNVSFTDDAGNTESLPSDPTGEVAAKPNTDATGQPTIDGTAQVGETLTANVTGIADEDGLTNPGFAYQWIGNDGTADTDIAGATGDTYALVADDVGKTIKVNVSFTDDAGNQETLSSPATAVVDAGAPTQPLNLTVTRGSQIQELVASWQAPASDGGSDIDVYVVQWKEASVSWDTWADVSKEQAFGTTYTITGLTGGTEYAVRVVAINVAGYYGPASSEATGTPAGGVSQQNAEPKNSDPTDPLTARAPDAPDHLNVSPHDENALDLYWEAPANDGGSPITGYKVQWKEAADSWDTPEDVSEETVTGTNHTIDGLTEGVQYTVRVMATNQIGEGPASAGKNAVPRETRAPEVVRSRVDGATLTVLYNEALDEGSAPPADAFDVRVTCRCDDASWQDEETRRAVDAVSVNGNTVELTLAEAATAEDYVALHYTPPSDTAAARTRDLASNAAAGWVRFREAINDTEEATESVTTGPLTASLHNVAQSHDGSTVFTFGLHFSEEFNLSYLVLKDYAFTVEGGTVTRATRIDKGVNIKRKIHIQPDGNGDVTIVLPITTDCEAEGAICTEDGRPLSNRLELVVSGPDG